MDITMKISEVFSGLLVLVSQLICSSGQVGQSACLQIYSVPEQTVVCQPSEEVRNQLVQLEQNVNSQAEQLVAMDTRIDSLDPDQPQELPEDVMDKLAKIDSMKQVQDNQSTLLSGLTDRVKTLTSALADLESANSREFSELVSTQTELIQVMWHHSNKSLHTEYLDSLNNTVTHFLTQLSLLELKLMDSILAKESQLLVQISELAARSRLEAETNRLKHQEWMQEYRAELELAREATVEHWNVTDRHSNIMVELSLKMEHLEMKLSNIQEQQVQNNRELQGVADALEFVKDHKTSLDENITSLQVNNAEIKQDLELCHSQTSNVRDEITMIRARLERWEHLTPRTLRVRNCQQALQYYHPVSGVYTINPSPALQPMEVYCHMDEDVGWTVIQSRQNGTVEFFRGWDDYVRGFGNADSEYWLGLEALHLLTTSGHYKLRVDLQDWRGKWWYAEYDRFSVDAESYNYSLHVSGYQGDAGDSLSYHDNMPFTTIDRNNDQKDGLCATWCHGAWWYRDCFLSNLNGRYYHNGPYVPDTNWGDGVNWKTTFNTYYYSFMTAAMKIRPVE